MESRRKSTEMRPEVGQTVMVRRHCGGLDNIAWGTVVGGSPGRYRVRVDGSFPDDVTGIRPYGEGDMVEFRRVDGFSVMAVRRTDR